MDKKQIQKHYTYLSQIYDDYVFADKISKNGSVNKEREIAINRQSNILLGFEGYISNNSDLKVLVEPKSNDSHKNIFGDEFLIEQDFSRVLLKLMRKMEGNLKKRK